MVKRKRDDSSESTSGSVLQFDNDSAASKINDPFPRGGSLSATPLEIRKANAAATNDVFDEVTHRKPKKTKTKAPKPAVNISKPRIQTLNFQSMKIGTLVLGQIAELHTQKVVVSLANDLIGFLDLDESHYRIGEYLRCVVAGLGEAPQRRLNLVAEPSLVNQTIGDDDYLPGMSIQGQITSVEDRGCILDLGFNRTGFLPKKNTLCQHLTEQKIILCTILKEKNGVLTLTQKPDHKLVTVHEQASLVPGTLLTVNVGDKLPNGAMCSIFGHIDASVDNMHTTEIVEGANEEARILFSHPPDTVTDSERVLALSMLKSTVELVVPDDAKAFKPGLIIEGAKIVEARENGLLVNIGVDKPGFIRTRHVSDEEIQDLTSHKRFRVGSVHRARILSYSLIDDEYYLTMEASVLSQRYLKYDEIEIGDTIEGSVKKFLPKGGILVSLGQNLVGICPEYALTDIKLTHPEKKFKQGQKISVRVINVEPEEQKVKLTAKKSIVTAQAPLISDLDKVSIGDKTIGTIYKLKDRGAVVELAGDVRGYLPAKEMSESLVTDPKAYFRVGQTVNVRVIDVNPDEHKILLSCRAKPRSEHNLTLLSTVSAEVVEITRDAVLVEADGALGRIPFGHLSDDVSSVKSVRKQIKVGSTLDNVLILTNSTEPLLTLKPSLLSHPPPLSVESISKGDLLYGFVRAVSDDKNVFVEFANNLVALMPKTIVKKAYTKDQSVSVVVTVNDVEKKLFIVAPSDNASQATDIPLVGDVVEATVVSVKSAQLNVVVGSSNGRIEVSQIFDTLDQIEDPKHPLQQFSKGDKIKCKVLGFYDSRYHRFLSTAQKTDNRFVLELSALENDTPGELVSGAQALAFVNNITQDRVFVNIGHNSTAQMSVVDLSIDAETVKHAMENYPIGSALVTNVIHSDPLVLSSAPENGLALIRKVYKTSLLVTAPHGITGFVAATDSSDSFAPLEKTFKPGQLHRCHVVDKGERDGKTWVSFRSSKDPADPIIQSLNDIKDGDIVRGFVKNIADAGIFIEIGRTVTGRAQISQLSDNYVKDWKKLYNVGDVVTAKVVSKTSTRIELSLKKSAITGDVAKQQGLEDLAEGQVLSGTVSSVQDYGVFVTLDDSGVSGLCHISEVADKPIENLSKVFERGDPVKVKILSIDLEKRKVGLGMKASYFEDGSDESDQEMPDADSESSEEAEALDQISDDDEVSLQSSAESDSDDDSADGLATNDKNGVSVNFDWNADILNSLKEDPSDEESDSEDEDDNPRKARKRRQSFTQDKTGTLNTRAPQSAQDFERLLVANPESSVLWMNYMAFLLQLSEVDSARAVARRALESIPLREQDEKQNIWIALLNLEHSFGTPETTREVFQEACKFMDPVVMHKKMAGIYAASGDLDEARNLWKTACRRFGSEDMDIWVQAAKFFFENGEADNGRELLERAVKVLPARLQKDLTLQFVKLEFNTGDPERGRTLLEGLVTAYPRKIDIWNVYLDQEIKSDPNNRKVITGLFERIISRKLSTKQAKMFFKKWLQYEVEHGDTNGVDYVKAKAQNYVNKTN